MKLLLLIALAILSFQAIIEQEVYDELKAKNGKVDVMVEMKKQVNWELFNQQLKSLDDITKGRLIVSTLIENAHESQVEVRKLLEEEKISFEDIWINNILAAKQVTLESLEKIAKIDKVERIWADKEVPANWEEPETLVTEKSFEPEWHLNFMNATRAWERGINGTGVCDSGVRYEHNSLVKSYRGNLGDKFDHNRSWFDPVAKAKVPVDNHSHGTHVTGTVAGGFERKIGMAPGAKWIHCRIADRSFLPSNVQLCQQFMLAPFDLDQKNPNPDLRPHTTSHSYTCGTCRLHNAMKALKAAGVYVISAAGNAGPRCGSANGEPANFAESLTVGALGVRTNSIAGFSSRGPVPNLQKPEIVAPGSNILSASRTSNTAYTTMSGTSMSTPGINGAIGLIWSAVPELVRKIDETNKVIFETANAQKSRDCSSQKETPNNVYGYGTLDVLKAIEVAKRLYGKK